MKGTGWIGLGGAIRLGALVALLALSRVATGQEPQGLIEQRVALDNDSVSVILLIFPPAPRRGATSALRRKWGSSSRAS